MLQQLSLTGFVKNFAAVGSRQESKVLVRLLQKLVGLAMGETPYILKKAKQVFKCNTCFYLCNFILSSPRGVLSCKKEPKELFAFLLKSCSRHRVSFRKCSQEAPSDSSPYGCSSHGNPQQRYHLHRHLFCEERA